MDFTSELDVTLIQHMGSDLHVAAAAKTSSSPDKCLSILQEEGEPKVTGLIKTLGRMHHGTPFEHNAMTFFVDAPIMVWREFHRHRIGFCLSGDTEIWTESIAAGSGRTIRKRPLQELWNVWENGVLDNMGRTRYLPSVKNQLLRVLNEDSGFFELGKIKDIVKSGVKECYFLNVDHKKDHHLFCTGEHQILTSDGWAKVNELSGNELIAVVGKKSAFEHRQIPPSLRSGIGVWTSMQRNVLIPNDTNCYICGEKFSRDDLVLDHVIPVAQDLQLALNPNNLKPACVQCHRTKTNSEQILAQRCNLAAAKFSRLTRKPTVCAEKMTYDISMYGPWHNFVANGIVVHNSFNEESGRYSQLRDKFYIPPRDRPMIPAPDHKPMRPHYIPLESDEAYALMVEEMQFQFRHQYSSYIKLIDLEIAKEVCREVLGVGVYSRCWVTCNARSMMNIMELRTHHPEANHPSYPQWEINQVVNKMENIFKELFPIVYAGFTEAGREAP